MKDDKLRTESLFSYGTLQLEAVQLAAFGRRLQGTGDSLRRFKLVPLDIDDPLVVEISGMAQHMMAKFTGIDTDLVPGIVFAVTAAEIEKADDYEVPAVKRLRVVLESGETAWAYIDVNSAPRRQ